MKKKKKKETTQKGSSRHFDFVTTQKLTNSGITLIALVITIIVLLILASVSIAMLTGKNGILTRGK